MNVFSFDFQLDAGKKAPFLYQLSEQNVSKGRIFLLRNNTRPPAGVTSCVRKKRGDRPCSRSLPSGQELKCSVKLDVCWLRRQSCPLFLQVYQRFGGTPDVIFRVEMNQRREVAADTKCERSESSEGGRQ
jgi:hypothetical protein